MISKEYEVIVSFKVKAETHLDANDKVEEWLIVATDNLKFDGEHYIVTDSTSCIEGELRQW